MTGGGANGMAASSFLRFAASSSESPEDEDPP
jgi:hypothetical protein